MHITDNFNNVRWNSASTHSLTKQVHINCFQEVIRLRRPFSFCDGGMQMDIECPPGFPIGSLKVE